MGVEEEAYLLVYYKETGGKTLPLFLTFTKGAKKMIRDIAELDDHAHSLKVKWDKARNFINTFALEFFEVKEIVDSGVYGGRWRNDVWILLNMGWAEPT